MSDVRDALGWLSFSQLFHYQSLSLLNKIIRAGEPECIPGQICTYRDSGAHVHPTRQDHLLLLPTIHAEAGQRHFLFSAPSMFNEIPIGGSVHKATEVLVAWSWLNTAILFSFSLLFLEFSLSFFIHRFIFIVLSCLAYVCLLCECFSCHPSSPCRPIFTDEGAVIATADVDGLL